MAIKKASFIIKGMQQDLGVSKFNPDYAYENYNIRIVAGKDNNSFNITNERGNYALETIDENTFEEFDIIGTPIGQAVVGKYLVLFTTENNAAEEDLDNTTYEYIDRIYRFYLDKTHKLLSKLLYIGNLNFRKYKPIETLPVYENEDIQKVYWTDGFNQPRMINVTASEESIKLWNDDYFNFVRILSFGETFDVTKHYSGGFFQSGVIQYAYAYYSKFGQLSNLVEVSPLYYISFIDRGGKPDETTSNSFEISVKNPDKTFEYIRFYSIYRTSINGTPLVKKVIDLPINQDTTEIRFTDTGTIGEVMDPTELYYIGGEDITVGTFTSKDNTLFLGDITIQKDRLENEELNNLIRNINIYEARGGSAEGDEGEDDIGKIINLYEGDISYDSPTYLYSNQLKYNSRDIKIFKSKERYRFGLQFQHISGKWSEPFFICDYTIQEHPTQIYDNRLLVFPVEASIPAEVINQAVSKGYVKIRPLVVYPSVTERKVICQGVVCPTVYQIRDRYNNAPFAQSSWFVRPFTIDDYDKNYSEIDKDTNYPDSNERRRPYGSVGLKGHDSFHNNKLVVFRHDTSIPSSDNGRNSEIQCNYQPANSPYIGYSETAENIEDLKEKAKNYVDEYGNDFFVDQSIVTLRSPDVEYDTEVQNLDLSEAKFRIVGRVEMSYTFSDIEVDTETLPNFFNTTALTAKGFYKNIDNKCIPGSTFCSAPMWLDQPTNIIGDAQTDRAALSSFIIYPFQKTGSLNNQPGADEYGYQTAKLKYKRLFNLKFANATYYNNSKTENPWTPSKGSNQILWNSSESTIVKIPNTNIVYKGVVDTAIINNRTYTYSVVWKGEKGTKGTDWKSNKYWEYYTYGGYPIVTTGRRLFSKDETQDENGTEVDSIINISTDVNLIKKFWDADYKLFYKLYLTKEDIEGDKKDKAEGIYKDPIPINNIQTNWESFDFDRSSYFSNSPIRMKYKSSPHVVISFNQVNDNYLEVLPYMKTQDGYNLNKCRTYTEITNAVNNSPYYGASPRYFWNTELSLTSGNQDYISTSDNVLSEGTPPKAFLWLGELYRDTDDNTMFGGTSRDAIMSNEWHVGGASQAIRTGYDVTLSWTEGDTYYQRYDHLNTYPFSLQEENGIIDIISFMCETRVNIDGRSDRNRSQETNHALTPNNYNLFNEVYNQKDNFFTYRMLDEDKFDLNKFPNTVTWTKEKIYGEFVDTWTNITMASTLDLDGNYGPIRSLNTFNNEIISFQDTGIANIIFNPMAQIATTEGLPIELANTGKVQGKRYISENIGCVNKWSIVQSPSGLYFLDNINKAIMSYNGGLSNLSDSFGFRRWAKSELNNTDIWEPEVGRAYAGFYDKLNNDILFINDSNCLAYSESLGAFSSFYSYENVPFVVNFDDKTIMLKEDPTTNKYKAWLHNEGRYNEFFGKHKEFYTTIICNESIDRDKIFNTVEYRADAFNGESAFYEYLPDKSFDLLTAETEYQKGYQILKYEKNKPSSLKKKFRIWRADIPRSQGTRDRIRNPWAHITLRKNPNDFNKLVLHDIVVYYTE